MMHQVNTSSLKPTNAILLQQFFVICDLIDTTLFHIQLSSQTIIHGHLHVPELHLIHHNISESQCIVLVNKEN